MTLDDSGGAEAAHIANPSPRPRIIVVVGGPMSKSKSGRGGFEAWCRLASEWRSFVCRIRPTAKMDEANSVQFSDSSALQSSVQCPSGQVVAAYLPDET
jgi:hypothetical protein